MSEWKTFVLGDLIEPIRTWDPSRSKLDEVFNYIDLSAIDQDAKLIIGARQLKCNEAPSRARQMVAKNDVLVSTVRPNLNGVALVPEDLDGATASTGFCVLRARASVLNCGYLFHWVKSPSFIINMVNKATGASYPAVSNRIVFESLLPIPPLAEQRWITERLDRVEALRAKRRAALVQLDTLTQSIFLDLFHKEKQFEDATLSEVTELKRGPFGGALKKEIFITCGYKVYEQRNAIQNDFKIGQYFISDSKYHEMENFAVTPGDLIVSCSGTLGRVAIMPEDAQPGIINQALLRIRGNKNKVTSLYLKHVLESVEIQNTLTGISHGTGLQNFPPMSGVRSLRLVVPPLTIQNEFSRRLSILEKLKTEHRTSLEKMNELFAALQYSAFRGEL